jgi:hypothetical protein
LSVGDSDGAKREIGVSGDERRGVRCRIVVELEAIR